MLQVSVLGTLPFLVVLEDRSFAAVEISAEVACCLDIVCFFDTVAERLHMFGTLIVLKA